ncbi:MAG: peptidylprolyl isomerase [Coriobacteriia bacterium]
MAPKSGDTVYVYHRVTTQEGKEIECSFGKEKPLCFVVDARRVLPGLNEAVKDLEKGDKAIVMVPAAKAHGVYDPGKIRKFRKSTFFQGLKVGQICTFQGELGEPHRARVLREEEDVYVLDWNHLLAGQDLTLELELVDIVEENVFEPFI